MNRFASGVLVLALTGCGQGLPASPPSTVSPSAATADFGSVDLSRIVLTEHDLRPGMTLDDLRTGLDALLQPLALEETELALQPGFVDARMTRIGTTGQDSYWEVGGYVTWVAVYESEADAVAAFDVLVTEHTSESGWRMEQVGSPAHGEEGVVLEGAAYGWDDNLLHIWRDANLLLAAGALGITATEDDIVGTLGSIADDMDIRTPAR